MQAHPYFERTDFIPGSCFQLQLGFDSGLQRLRGSGKSRLEFIPNKLKNDAAVCLNCFPQNSVMDMQGCRHLLRLLLPTWCGTLNVREQKSHRASWKLRKIIIWRFFFHFTH
jgi:hypothetical protein